MRRSVSRFGSSRHRAELEVIVPAASLQQDERPVTPMAGETMYEIGVVIALHLAFAFVVVLTLRAFGMN